MTIKELKDIINTLPDDAVLLVLDHDIGNVETISVAHHSDGRKHVIFSTLE